ncbi:MAG: hypothetical protein ACRCVJ_18905 [Clostridium sp.]|uniref:hypothetical protein n=1 Tax=Clostridium sp. TaxID=1506 RepID=UPI003F3C38C0
MKKFKFFNLESLNPASNCSDLNQLVNLRGKALTLQTIIILIGLLLHYLFTIIGNKLSMPIYSHISTVIAILLLVFIISSAIYISSIFKRIVAIKKEPNNFRDVYDSFIWTITIKNQEVAPDINKLSFLGKWTFVTATKKNVNYYYRLESTFSSEDIISNISTHLNIDKKLISTADSRTFAYLNWILPL